MKLGSTTILILSLLAVVILAALTPSPIDWKPKYGTSHQDPLGLSVLFNEIGELFPSTQVTKVNRPIYNVLTEEHSVGNYIIINRSFEPDQLDLSHLLRFVEQGGNAFIAAEQINYLVSDTLGIELSYAYNWRGSFIEDSVRTRLFFENLKFENVKGKVPQTMDGSDLASLDSLSYGDIQFLGRDEDDEIVFLRKKIGLGYIYLHTIPAVFSNYELLYEDMSEYVSACLSYLPVGNTYFDDYYVVGKAQKASSLSVLLSKPAMQWAWNIMLLSVLLFLIFGGRRKSRAIPVLKPYQNDSVQYAETIGAMHYNHRNNKHIAKKRLEQLKRYLHRRFRIGEELWSIKNPILFEEGTKVEMALWKELFDFHATLSKNAEWTMEDLMKYSNLIDKIYEQIKNN